MSKRRHLALVLLLVALTLPLACGGDEGEPPGTRAQFAAQADSICKQLRQRAGPLSRRLDRTSNAGRQVELLRRRHGYEDEALARLRELDVPEQDKATVAQYLSALEKRRDLGRRLEDAVGNEDLARARAILVDDRGVNRVAYRAAIRLGLDQCERARPASSRDVLDAFTPDVGVPITLSAEGTTLKLTVEAVIDPLEAGASPPVGTRLVGIQLIIENTGERSVEIPLAQQATLTTNRNDELDPAFAASGGECQESLNVTILSAGSTRNGCIPFQVPQDERAKAFQFVGFGGDPAEWDLTSARPISGTVPAENPQGQSAAESRQGQSASP
jgi:hypothetical protein